MKKSILNLYIIIIIISISSCSVQYEKSFDYFSKMDFSEFCDYGVQQRNGCFYMVLFCDTIYLAKMPVDSNGLLSLNKPYYYFDQSTLTADTIKMLSVVSKEDLKYKDVESICLLFRRLCSIDPKHIYVSTLAVSTEHDILITGVIKRNKHYDLIITDKQRFDNIFDDLFVMRDGARFSKEDFIELRESVFYRIQRE